MDLANWGLRNWPFERSYAADQFFSSPMHEEALARLLFLVEESRRSGIVVGPSGTGKTFLLKLVEQRAERSGRITVRCDAVGLDGNELLSQIAAGCFVAVEPDASPARIWSGLSTKFTALKYVRQPIVVIIDHFDLVDFRSQQTVCRLRQVADSIGVKLTLIVATRDRVVPSILQDVLDLRIELAGWSFDETMHFISTALSKAGTSASFFTDEALHTIHDLTGGIPASVVSLCNLSLLAAVGCGDKLITSQIVEAAVDELSFRPSTTGEKRRPLEARAVAGS
jgi:general secretion pathway protein A